MLGIVIASSITLFATANASAVLAPTAAWSLDYGKNACTLSRPFGTDKNQITLGIKPPLTDGHITIATMIPEESPKPSRFGKAILTMNPGISLQADASIQSIASGKIRVAKMNVDEALINTIESAKTITLTLPDSEPRILAMTGITAALKALKQCNAELQKRFGLDPVKIALIEKSAIGDSPGYWITQDDYPSEAIKLRQEGTVEIVWKIGVDGRVSDCQLTSSSNSPLLDAAACAAITRRGRYKPALDHDGNTISSWNERKVIWTLP